MKRKKRNRKDVGGETGETIHRKKQTNTLYTINALNAAVALDNDGQTGRHLKLDWDKYQNSILLTEGKNLKVYPVEVLKIFKIEDPPEEN